MKRIISIGNIGMERPEPPPPRVMSIGNVGLERHEPEVKEPERPDSASAEGGK